MNKNIKVTKKDTPQKSGLLKCVQQIQEAVKDLEEKHKFNFENNLLIAYRGESCDYGKTKLVPTIFRSKEYVDKETYLFNLMSDYDMISLDSSNIDKLIESQHYISISRVLDISFNALIALYFACNSNHEKDANFFVFGFPKHYSPNSSYIIDYYTNTLENKFIPYDKNFKVISHSLSNDRIKAQSGGFIFFPGKDYYPIDECYYRIINIPKEDKENILNDLNQLFNINKYKIFPEKQNIVEVIKDNFNSYKYEGDILNYENELITYFKRLDYELTLRSRNSKEVLRFLRKEKNDLEIYIDSNVKSKEEEDKYKIYLDKVNKFFEKLILKYKENREK